MKIGDTVHYVSYGTPVRSDGSQAYNSMCRAAIVTDVNPGLLPTKAVEMVLDGTNETLGLFITNPSGTFFAQCPHSNGFGKIPGPGCPNSESHVFHNSCPTCDYRMHGFVGGTWHSPEECEAYERMYITREQG